jgi:putative intracellular protease/amidase
MGVPDAVYTATLIYQKRAVIFGPFLITSCGTHSGSNTTYTGSFDPLAFPGGSLAQITGFVTNAVNNGTFVVVSCTATTLIVANGSGVAETASAFVSNFDWAPIPDQYSDIYNNLFLSEMLASVDDARSQMFRQRGVAAYLAKAQGLTETQRNAFIQQWLARGVEEMVVPLRAQQGTQARAV